MSKFVITFVLGLLIGVVSGAYCAVKYWQFEVTRACALNKYYDSGTVYHFIPEQLPDDLKRKELGDKIVYKDGE